MPLSFRPTGVKKAFIAVAIAVVLAAAGGTTWYVTRNNAHRTANGSNSVGGTMDASENTNDCVTDSTASAALKNKERQQNSVNSQHMGDVIEQCQGADLSQQPTCTGIVRLVQPEGTNDPAQVTATMKGSTKNVWVAVATVYNGHTDFADDGLVQQGLGPIPFIDHKLGDGIPPDVRLIRAASKSDALSKIDDPRYASDCTAVAPAGEFPPQYY